MGCGPASGHPVQSEYLTAARAVGDRDARAVAARAVDRHRVRRVGARRPAH